MAVSVAELLGGLLSSEVATVAVLLIEPLAAAMTWSGCPRMGRISSETSSGLPPVRAWMRWASASRRGMSVI